MLKYLMRGFRRTPSPPKPAPRALPNLNVPVTALVPVPSNRPKGDPIAAADWLLTEETNDTVAAELEECFAMMRARQHIDQAQRRLADGEFLVSMGVVEKFANESLDFGPEKNHHIPVKSLAKAFERWVKASGRYEVRKESFVRAMTTVLEWQGGHRSVIDGQELFVGCSLTPRFVESMGSSPGVSESKDRLGMGIAELSGGRLLPG